MTRKREGSAADRALKRRAARLRGLIAKIRAGRAPVPRSPRGKIAKRMREMR